MSDFLKRLSRDPYAPIDGASVTRVDELGNGYDDWGHLIAPKLEAPQQTWGETALGVATAPARLATAVAGSISPYGPNGWQVPPIINEGGDALTAVGDAYTQGMDNDEINRRALGMAGFMMGGGGLAAGRAPMVAANASKEASVPAIVAGQEVKPLRGYHGTTHEIEGRLRPNGGARGQAVYFNTSPSAASSYAGGDVGNYARFAPDGDHPSVLPVDITGKVYDENSIISTAELRRFAETNNRLVEARNAEKGRKTYPDELQDPNEFASGYFDRAYPPNGYNVLESLAGYEPDAKLALLRELGFDGTMGRAAGLTGGSDIAMFNPNTVRSATTGEILFSNSDNSASVPAIAGALDMSTEARLARAREMGFDTDRVLYHGTGKDFQEFEPGTRGNGTRRNIYLTDNPDIADIYANSQNYGLKGGGDPMIYPLYAKAEKPLVVSDKGPDGSFGWVSDNLAAALGVDHPPAGKYATLYDEARRQGYDQVQIREMTDLGGPQTQYIPLKPEYIRSVNAAFDPAKSDSANILAANADSRPALLAGAGQEQDDGYADGGRVGLPSPYSVAKSMIGQREGRGNDLLNRFLNGDTSGMTSAEYAWCSRFVKQAAAKAGVDVSKATDMARSWLDVGQPVDKPSVGDVVVLSRGNPNSQYGHVGFYEGTNPDGTIKLLSGNHNNAVASGSYPASRVLGYRRLDGQPEAYDPATGQQGLKPLAMMDGVGRETPALQAPTPETSQVAETPKPSFDLTKLASLFAEPEQAQAPQVNFTPIQAFQPQGSPIQASTPYRGTFADGGQVRGLPDQSEPIHAGPLHSTVPGRTDHLPITVAAGSFVLPADIVSSLGEGNTNAGMETVSKMFPLPPVRRADGGRVPIAAAGGEYVIAPETVAALGDGDLETGHDLLDQFVRRTRAQNIQRLRALPGPEK